MAVPKCKVSKARRDKRRGSNWKLAAPGVVACPKCGEFCLPHRACKACGFLQWPSGNRCGVQVRGKEHERKAFWAFLFFYPDDGGFCRYYVQQDINQIALTLQDARKDVFSATRGLYFRSSF